MTIIKIRMMGDEVDFWSISKKEEVHREEKVFRSFIWNVYRGLGDDDGTTTVCT